MALHLRETDFLDPSSNGENRRTVLRKLALLPLLRRRMDSLDPGWEQKPGRTDLRNLPLLSWRWEENSSQTLRQARPRGLRNLRVEHPCHARLVGGRTSGTLPRTLATTREPRSLRSGDRERNAGRRYA